MIKFTQKNCVVNCVKAFFKSSYLCAVFLPLLRLSRAVVNIPSIGLSAYLKTTIQLASVNSINVDKSNQIYCDSHFLPCFAGESPAQ